MSDAPVNCTEAELAEYLKNLRAGLTCEPCTYSPEQAGESSPTNSLATPRSVRSRSMSIASKPLRQGKRTAAFHGFPSLRMSSNLMVGLGAGVVDIVAGGFPCTDISLAGKGAGIDGEQSGLWSEMARIIGEVRPRFAFVENSPALVTRGIGRVVGDLAALGYDCRWTVLGAADVGAPHKRDRIWIVANANCVR